MPDVIAGYVPNIGVATRGNLTNGTIFVLPTECVVVVVTGCDKIDKMGGAATIHW